MEFLKTYVYDHRIARTIKEDSADSVQWIIEEVKAESDHPNSKYQLAFKVKNKKYYVKTISYTGYVNPDIKQYDITSIEDFMKNVEQELFDVNFSIKFNTKNEVVLNKDNNNENSDSSIPGWKVGNDNNTPESEVSKPKKMRL